MNETNEHNPDGCTNHFSDGSKIFPNRDCCDQSARIVELERRVEELTEEKDRLQFYRNESVKIELELRAEVERLTKERDEARAEAVKCPWEIVGKFRRITNAIGYADVEDYINTLRDQLAEREEDRKFCESILRQYDRLKETGQVKMSGTLLVVQDFEIAAIRAARAQPEDGK